MCWLASIKKTVIYIHSDHLNTPKAVTDQNQKLVWKGDYEPFGEVEAAIETVEMNLRFPGQYQDDEIDTYHNFHRDYSPEIGRYLQPDFVGLADGPNIYSYARQNPVSKYDPLGLNSCGAEGGAPFPSNMLAYSFEYACAKHDKCYEPCGANKLACDLKFNGDLLSECRKIPPTLMFLVQQCFLQAQSYFAAVLFGGDAAYKRAQENCDGCDR